VKSIHLFAELEPLLESAALRWEEWVLCVLDNQPYCHVALSGGSTPLGLYRLLAIRNRLPWSRIVFWYGDERLVQPGDPAGNHLAASEAMFVHLAIDSQLIHPMWDGRIDPQTAARHYRELLADNLPERDGFPCFDLLMLGLGEDGHIASLFPGSDGLEEEHLSVVAHQVEHQYRWRMTLTRPVIERANRVLFLVAGSGKQEALRRALAPPGDRQMPVERLSLSGEVEWFIDRGAAGRLAEGLL
jgi:6-phosphogluconolactonase